MDESALKTADPPHKPSEILGFVCLAFCAFGFLVLLPMLFFSLGPLIATDGRAWEHDPVRELFIASLAVFALLVVSPLVAAYSLLRKRRWAKAPVMVTAIASLLFGVLVVISAVSLEWYESIILSVPCLVLGVYVFWALYRRDAV